MKLYKRILETIVDFGKLSEEQKSKDIYIHKHIYFSWLIISMFTTRFEKAKRFFLELGAIDIVLIISTFIFNKYWLMIIPGLTLPILLAFCIYKVYLDMQLKRKTDNEERKKYISKLQDRIANFSLLNFRVIPLKVWRQIKRENKEWYQHLRSEECNHYCYTTTRELANYMKDPKIKILWISAKNIVNGKEHGHAVLVKNNYIYDTNLRRTYKYGTYIKCYEAKRFKRISICDYTNQEYMNVSFREFSLWCKKHGVLRSIEDN